MEVHIKSLDKWLPCSMDKRNDKTACVKFREPKTDKPRIIKKRWSEIKE